LNVTALFSCAYKKKIIYNLTYKFFDKKVTVNRRVSAGSQLDADGLDRLYE